MLNIVPNTYGFLSSVENKKNLSNESQWGPTLFGPQCLKYRLLLKKKGKKIIDDGDYMKICFNVPNRLFNLPSKILKNIILEPQVWGKPWPKNRNIHFCIKNSHCLMSECLVSCRVFSLMDFHVQKFMFNE